MSKDSYYSVFLFFLNGLFMFIVGVAAGVEINKVHTKEEVTKHTKPQQSEERSLRKDTVPFRAFDSDSEMIVNMTQSRPLQSGNKEVENIQNTQSVESSHSDTVYVDTAQRKVIIPISQKVYKDSDYTAWVSGYKPSLDSIVVRSKTFKMVERNHVKRWNVGITGGYGITPKGLQPFIGIGVTWNVFK